MRWGSMHPGQDFAVPVGTPVKAMSSGTVIFAGWQGGYGNKVEIQYWDGTVSWFCHNSKLVVSQGEKVTPGELVSMSGNTGHSTGPHIHVEIHPQDGSPISPLPWLKKMGTMP
jgi:murein DD-endopeptidase MepM/ murein hydrolase activator NlpD